jgi:tRNA-modifying protein YgfZ
VNATTPALPALSSLTAVLITGADARTFLQGQLSCDLRRLAPQAALLGSCNSAQGRVQIVLTLVQRDDGIAVIVPATLATRLVTRLRGYVLRSKVQFPEEPALVLAPLTADQASGLVEALPQMPGTSVTRGSLSLMRWWSADERYLLIAPRESLPTHEAPETDLNWRRADIAAGLPQVYPETHESFVAQMLNLDLLGGISFDKGCYTGQEIVARTHYRGTIKRRMLRFAADCASPVPGTRIVHAGTHAGEVVDACAATAGSGHDCELLAVISMDHMHGALELDGMADSALTRLTLPYALPQAEAA